MTLTDQTDYTLPLTDFINALPCPPLGGTGPCPRSSGCSGTLA